MSSCGACGTLTLGSGACPHCGSERRGGLRAAFVLLALTGCVGVPEGDDKSDDHTGTSTVQPAYGISTTGTDDVFLPHTGDDSADSGGSGTK